MFKALFYLKLIRKLIYRITRYPWLPLSITRGHHSKLRETAYNGNGIWANVFAGGCEAAGRAGVGRTNGWCLEPNFIQTLFSLTELTNLQKSRLKQVKKYCLGRLTFNKKPENHLSCFNVIAHCKEQYLLIYKLFIDMIDDAKDTLLQVDRGRQVDKQWTNSGQVELTESHQILHKHSLSRRVFSLRPLPNYY